MALPVIILDTSGIIYPVEHYEKSVRIRVTNLGVRVAILDKIGIQRLSKKNRYNK